MFPLTAHDLSAVPADRLGDRGEIGRLAILGGRGPGEVMNRHVRAELGEPLRHHAPEPAARAGDERDFASELLGHPSDSSLNPKPIARMLSALRRIIASS